MKELVNTCHFEADGLTEIAPNAAGIGPLAEARRQICGRAVEALLLVSADDLSDAPLRIGVRVVLSSKSGLPSQVEPVPTSHWRPRPL